MANALFRSSSGILLEGMPVYLSRFLDGRVKRLPVPDDPTVQFSYEFDRTVGALARGEWDVDYRADLVDENLNRGEMQTANCYLFWHGLINVERGEADRIRSLLEESDRVCSFYDNDEARLHSSMIRTRYHLKFRKYEEAVKEGRSALAISEKIGLGVMQFWILGHIAQAELSLGNGDEASRLLDEMKRWTEETEMYPFALAPYQIARLKQLILEVESPRRPVRASMTAAGRAQATVSKADALS